MSKYYNLEYSWDKYRKLIMNSNNSMELKKKQQKLRNMVNI